MMLSTTHELLLEDYLQCKPEYHYYLGQKFSFDDMEALMGGRVFLENGAIDVQEILPLDLCLMPEGVIGFVQDTMQDISAGHPPRVLLFSMRNQVGN